MDDRIGDRLRRLRTKRVLSQKVLAELAGLSERTLQRIEARKRDPRIHEIEQLASALGVQVVELWGSSDSNTRDVRALIDGGTKARTIVDDERLGYACDFPGRVDQHAIQDLGSLTQLYAGHTQALAPVVLLPAVLDFMGKIRWLLTGSHSDSTRARLQLLYAENGVVAGRVAFWADDRGQAGRLFKMSADLAEELNENQLRALALSFRADLHSSVPYIGTLPGNTKLALSLFNEAASLDEPSWPPLLRAWVLGCRAEEYASLKRGNESDRDMDEAHRAIASARPGQENLIHVARAIDITGGGAAGLSGFEGACALALGRSRQAREAFEAGLKEAPSVGRLSGLAASYALEGDAESAADLLIQGLEEAIRRQLPTRLRRVEGVRVRYLSNANDHPAVQRFDQRFREAIA